MGRVWCLEKIVPERLLTVVLLAAASAAWASPSGEAEAPATGSAPDVQSVVHKGIRVEFSITPVEDSGGAAGRIVEGRTVEARFRITDNESGSPISPLQPAVWISSEEPGAADLSCRDRIGRYVQGMLGFQADVDLNKYFLLVLNHDRSISIIDPLLGVSGITQLYGSIPLDEPGEDWLVSPDGRRLYVSMPAAGRVAVIELEDFEVLASIDVGSGPFRLGLQPDGRYLWVANDGPDGGAGGVTAVDTRSLELAGSVVTGSGHHEIAFTDDSLFALVTNDADGTLSVVDTQKLVEVAEITTGQRPVAVRFSRLSGSAYVADLGGSVAVIRAGDWRVARRIETGGGVAAFEIDPSGRWGFAAQTALNRVAILDTSEDAIVHRLEVGSKPFQLAFTDTYAYVRHLGTAEVKLIPLAQLAGRDTVGLQGVAFGNLAPEESPFATVASSISSTGEYGAVLAANPADRMVYYYMEGMVAPMGSYTTYGRVPKAVAVADRSVREREPGVYSAKFRVPRAGLHDVTFLLDRPLVDHCFTFVAEADAERAALEAGRVVVEFARTGREVPVGEPHTVRLTVRRDVDGSAVAALGDVMVIASRPPGSWQQRMVASALGDGLYEVTIPPDQPGVYYVNVAIPSLGLDVTELPFMTFQVTAAPPASASRG